MALLRFENVQKQYQAADSGVLALDGVSFEAAAGEFLAVTGRSGCGKSTLLHLAGGMDYPTSGRVWIDGAATAGLSDAEMTVLRRRKVGFVFQFFQLLPTLTAVENVELPLQLAGQLDGRQAALDRLRWVEMEAFAQRFPHQLSGGEMQRVAIARAMVHSPRLILADEPIGNLDSASAELVLRLLRRAADELGATVLMATHSAESAQLADRVIRLCDGRIEEIRGPA